MEKKSSTASPPALYYIDEEYKKKIDEIKKRYEKDADHIINRLESKHIYMLAISYALKNGLKPKKSRKKAWIFRTEYLKEDDMSILKSLVYGYCKDITILIPENYNLFHEMAEGLANSGMDYVLEILKNPTDIEKTILLEARKVVKK